MHVNVLLHELYPMKGTSKTAHTDHQLDASSQEFLKALRKMDIEDLEDLEEANFLFESNHISLSSFIPPCSLHRPNYGSSTTRISVPDEDSISQTDLTSPLDPLWIEDDRTLRRPADTPDNSYVSSSFSSARNPSELPEPVHGLADMVPGKPESTVGTSVCTAYSVEGDVNSDEITSRTLTSNVAKLSKLYVSEEEHGLPRASSKSCRSISEFYSFESDSPMPCLASSGSDSEVDYRTEYREQKNWTHNRKLECGSSSLPSPKSKGGDQDYQSCSSSLDSITRIRPHSYTAWGHGKSDHHLRDMEAFTRAEIPFSYEEVIQASNEAFKEMRTSCSLTDNQINVMLDVRKRASNRIAAERCRRLKLATRDELAEQLASLRLERQLLQRQVVQARQRKQKASDALLEEQKRVLLLLRDSDGNQLKYTDWRIRLTHDDEVVVVAAGH